MEYITDPYLDAPRYPFKEHYIQCLEKSTSPTPASKKPEAAGSSTQRGEKRVRKIGTNKPVHN
jgi:hypothetical protein